MRRVKFTVPFTAHFQRPRPGKNGGYYSPHSKMQKIISQFALCAMVDAKLNPFKGDVHFYLTVFGGKADGSNFLKCAEDACNGVVYDDDRQIVFGSYKLNRVCLTESMDIEVAEL